MYIMYINYLVAAVATIAFIEYSLLIETLLDTYQPVERIDLGRIF